jgi:hypothetical protein
VPKPPAFASHPLHAPQAPITAVQFVRGTLQASFPICASLQALPPQRALIAGKRVRYLVASPGSLTHFASPHVLHADHPPILQSVGQHMSLLQVRMSTVLRHLCVPTGCSSIARVRLLVPPRQDLLHEVHGIHSVMEQGVGSHSGHLSPSQVRCCTAGLTQIAVGTGLMSQAAPSSRSSLSCTNAWCCSVVLWNFQCLPEPLTFQLRQPFTLP